MILGTLRLPNICVASVTYDDPYTYASHDPIVGKPRAVFVGEGAPPCTLSLMLHASHLDPGQTIAQLRELAATAEVLVLQDDGGTLRGQYVIEGVANRPIWTLPDGRIIATRVEVRLIDPGVEPVEVPDPNAVQDAPGLQAAPAPPPTPNPPKNTVPVAQIARLAAL